MRSPLHPPPTRQSLDGSTPPRARAPPWLWLLLALAWVAAPLLWASSGTLLQGGSAAPQHWTSHRRQLVGGSARTEAALRAQEAAVERAAEVREAFQHAWAGYKRFAWVRWVGGAAPVRSLLAVCAAICTSQPVDARASHQPHPSTQGADGLRPVSQQPRIVRGGLSGMGVTIVDALSTLHLLGLHDDFAQ